MKICKITLRQDGNEFEVCRFSNTVQLSIGMRVPVGKVEEWCAMSRVQVDIVGCVEKGDDSELPLLSDAAPRLVADASPDDVAGNVFELAREFDALMIDNALTHQWASEAVFMDMTMPDMGKNNLGSMGIQAAIRRNQAIARCRIEVAKELGLDTAKIGGCKYRAENLNALKSFCGELQPF